MTALLPLEQPLTKIVGSTTTGCCCSKQQQQSNNNSNSTSSCSRFNKQTQTQKMPKKKCVSFSPKANVRPGLHINNYTDEEMKASFYTKTDYRNFKEDGKLTARMIDNEQLIGDIGFCKRGVECLTRKGMQVRFVTRKAACLAVLAEQESIKRVQQQQQQQQQSKKRPEDQESSSLVVENDNDGNDEKISILPPADERIAHVYANASAESVALAYQMGLEDEKMSRMQRRADIQKQALFRLMDSKSSSFSSTSSNSTTTSSTSTTKGKSQQSDCKQAFSKLRKQGNNGFNNTMRRFVRSSSTQ